jgi:isochorismate synthase EntC
VETVDFFPEKINLPFPSSQDLATQAAADLTHALLHPQPGGPFCKVGDEQTIALKRLASIFADAKQRKSKTMLTPTDGIEDTAPQRGQTTVSPPRVAGTDSEQISLQPNISSHSTPNSHRRQKTPARLIVTPQTPHVMVRRSARQQHNLSQDMMTETINQANSTTKNSKLEKTKRQ